MKTLLITLALVAQASASLITGSMVVNGVQSSKKPFTGPLDASSLSSMVSHVAWSDFKFPTGDKVVWTHRQNPLLPTFHLGSFQFVMESYEIVEQSPKLLIISSKGTIHYKGFDKTPGNLNIIFEENSKGTARGYSAEFIADVSPVPEAGSSCALMFLGLGSVFLRKR